MSDASEDLIDTELLEPEKRCLICGGRLDRMGFCEATDIEPTPDGGEGRERVTPIKPEAPMSPWSKSTFLQRALDCQTFLSAHGFLSDAEKQNVRRRIEKYLQAHHPEARLT